MEYLLYLRPPERLQHLLYSFRQNIQSYLLAAPEAGDHVTLMNGRFCRQDEEALIGSLAGIELKPFPVKLERLAFFDEPSPERPDKKNLVVLLQRSAALQQLQQEVADIGRQFIYWKETPSFSQFPFPQDQRRKAAYTRYGSPYLGEFYNPHLSIGEVKPGLEEWLWEPSFLDYEWSVEEFYLARKEGGKWKEIQKFSLE